MLKQKNYLRLEIANRFFPEYWQFHVVRNITMLGMNDINKHVENARPFCGLFGKDVIVILSYYL